MSIFGKIKDAIFGKDAKAQDRKLPDTPIGGERGTAGTQAAPTLSEVDVEAELQRREDAKGQDLNWRSSIVDLMKLLDIDSSLENRKQLAQELGYTGMLNGSAEMNIWLHKATMRKLQQNGGRVPASMLD